MTNRSTTLRNSRMLPRHGALDKAFNAAGSKRGRHAQVGGDPTEKMLHQQWHVLTALRQARQVNRDDVDPMEQILTESPFRNFSSEVLVGGCEDPDIDRNVLVSAHPLDDLLLQARSILAWAGSAMSPISSRKSVPRACSNRPLRCFTALKGSFFVPKELGLDQLRRDGRVDLYKGPFPPLCA